MLRRIVGLWLILIMVAMSPSLPLRFQGQRHAEILFTQSPIELNFISASETLEPIFEKYLNPVETRQESNVIVEYDVQTGMEEVYTINYDEIHSNITRLEPYEGNYPHYLQGQHIYSDSITEILHTSSELGPDELTQVFDTTVFPFSSVVKIYADYNETHTVAGSGAMIDSNHVLTAGHVVYDITHGGWRENVRVIPGKDGPLDTSWNEPYGRAYATIMRSTEGWTQDSSARHDWAVITLDRDIGNETGWLGVTTLPLDHNNYTDVVYTAGYPATTLSGYYMYTVNKSGGYLINEFQHQYNFYVEGGQSGSSAWTYQNSSPYVLSVVAYGPEGGGIGSGTRITTEKFDLLNLWLEQDASEEPQADLTVSGSNNILAALGYVNAVNILFTKFPIVTSVQNYGNIGVEQATLGYYLSEDANITPEDYLIGTTTVRDINVSESKIVNYTAKIPLSVPPGFYEIGWIVDPNNEIDEFFEDNNVYVNGLKLHVHSTIVDQILTDPLWLSLTITGVALILILPIVLVVIRKKKRRPKTK